MCIVVCVRAFTLRVSFRTFNWFNTVENSESHQKSKLKQNRLSDVHSSFNYSVVVDAVIVVFVTFFFFCFSSGIFEYNAGVFWVAGFTILLYIVNTYKHFGWFGAVNSNWTKSFTFSICSTTNNCAVSISIWLLLIVKANENTKKKESKNIGGDDWVKTYLNEDIPLSIYY